MRSGCLLVAMILIRGQAARTRPASAAAASMTCSQLSRTMHLVTLPERGGQPVKRARAGSGRPGGR